MILKPIGARVLIQPFQSADKTESGLIMENNSNTSAAPTRGIVIEAGDQSRFKKGDELFWRRYSVDELKTITPKGEIIVSVVDDEDVLLQVINENTMSDNYVAPEVTPEPVVATPVETAQEVVVEEAKEVVAPVEEAIVEEEVVA